MTDGVKISVLDPLTTLTGTEEFPIATAGENYRVNVLDLGHFLVTALGINIPPIAVPSTASSIDTDLQLTGNLLAGDSDPNGDAFYVQTLSYNGTSEPFADGSFQTTYGVFYLDGSTGNWTFTLGPGARALVPGTLGHEVFTYTLADGRGGLATSTLTISILGTVIAPVVSAVNNQTPINTTVSGNLLNHSAIDFKNTTLTISTFVIEGIGGTWAAGSTQTMSGVGTITINANGDYTFVPATDFFGPVPTIVYTVTDGTGSASTYLRLAVTPLIPGTQPIVIQTDTESCPTSGGENNNGGYLSILGFRFGSPSGLGTTTKVFIGGQEVAAYFTLESARIASKFVGLQHLRVQVGALGGVLTPGEPYPITVVVSGQSSNASLNFTPNPGRIIYVSLTGNDSTAVPNDITKPFRHLQFDDPPAGPGRGTGGVYPILRAGDQVVIRGGEWSDSGWDTAWFRFRDPIQQGSVPTGASGSGWIGFVGYPNEDVHYSTAEGNKGGFQGPNSAFEGTCGDWTYYSNMHIDVPAGGAQSDGAPINLQSMSQRCRIVNNELGPWVAGDSAYLNAACVTGQGNRVIISCNQLHDIEGTSALQNHGIYGGTSAYGWEISFNWIYNCVGGSGIQFNDSESGTGTKNTPFGVWTGFTNILIHHNWIENTAKYGITFADPGVYAGDLSFRAYNNVIVGTNLAPLRLQTQTTTSDGLYAFNTVYDCNRENSGTGTAILRNEGVQSTPGHSIKAYDNIFAFGPNTVAGTGWYYDYSGEGNGYDLKRNLYFANGQSPSAPSTFGDNVAVIGDPLFNNAAGSDFSLQSSSPAANAGTQPLPSDLVVYDDFTALATRAYGGAPDIGAFEIPQATPYVITAPASSGAAQIGATSTVTLGSWGNSPTGYSRQFTVGGANVGSPITGTGAATYTPVVGNERQVLACNVTATNGAGSSVYTVTIGTVAVGAGAPVCTSAPTISGVAQDGSTLTGSDGTWTGTVDSFSYQWLRGAAPISGATSSTYVQTGADVGSTILFEVIANNATTGSVIAFSAATAAVAPAPADPNFIQDNQLTLLSSGTQTVSTTSNVEGNNLLVSFLTVWNNHAYNATLTDSQGNSSNSSNFTRAADIAGPSSGNPTAEWAFVVSNASGPYSLSVNTNVSNGGTATLIEVGGVNDSSILDIPSDTASDTTATVTLTASMATTKPNDLVLVGVAAQGTGHTFTTPSGWTQIGSTLSVAYQSVAVFYRKEAGIETFSFSSTLDSATGWIAASLVIKGS